MTGLGQTTEVWSGRQEIDTEEKNTVTDSLGIVCYSCYRSYNVFHVY